jgi:hypothetical protein
VWGVPESERAFWSKFVRETYARSPVVRKHLREFKDWKLPARPQRWQSMRTTSKGNSPSECEPIRRGVRLMGETNVGLTHQTTCIK